MLHNVVRLLYWASEQRISWTCVLKNSSRAEHTAQNGIMASISCIAVMFYLSPLQPQLYEPSLCALLDMSLFSSLGSHQS